MIARDVPLEEFATVKYLKQSEDTIVSVVKHLKSDKEYVIKAYNKEIVMKGNMIDSVIAERDILRLISGIQVEQMFEAKSAPVLTIFP